jgi:hypothetical protein
MDGRTRAATDAAPLIDAHRTDLAVLADALRALFVEVVVKTSRPDPKARTDLPISLLTEVDRKENYRMSAPIGTSQAREFHGKTNR